jgi:hypothetical protein
MRMKTKPRKATIAQRNALEAKLTLLFESLRTAAKKTRRIVFGLLNNDLKLLNAYASLKREAEAKGAQKH